MSFFLILSRYNSDCKDQLDQLNKRNIPILIGEKTITNHIDINKFIKNSPKPEYYNNDPNNFIFESLKLGLSGSDNPLPNVYYYDKESYNECYKLDSNDFSFIIPENHQELVIRFYVKNRKKNKHIENAQYIWNNYIKSLDS